jgi:PAS domain S-box/diguanylate cyclase (GGDEF) domain
MSAAFWAFCDIFYYTMYLPIKPFSKSFYEVNEYIQFISLYTYAPIMLHCVICFTNLAVFKRFKYTEFLIYLPALIFLIGNIFTEIYSDKNNVNITIYLETVYYSFYALLNLAFVLFWGRRAKTGRGKKQAGIILKTGIASYVTALVYQFGVQIIWQYDAPAFTEVIMLIIITGIWYAITKYNLIGINDLVKAKEIIDEVNDFILLVDWNRKIINVNKSLTVNLGYCRDELIGKPINLILEDGYDFNKFLVDDSSESYFEFEIRSVIGRNIPVSARSRRINDSMGDMIGSLLICKDMRIVKELQMEVSYRKQKEIQLNYMGMHDALTGLYNRTFFEEEIQRLEQSKRKSLGMIICDVDGLKLINDTLGHLKGDDLLIRITRILKDADNENIVAARIGGDEFAVLLPDCSQEQLENEEQRIRNAVAKDNSISNGIPLNISTGSAFTSDRSKSVYTLYKEADNTMYREKLNHKGSSRNITIQALANMMKARDFSTQEHTNRMKNLAEIFGQRAGLSPEKLNTLSLLVQFHDIGKVGIADNILFKKAPLTTEEMEEMKKHTEIGYKIAFATPDIAPIAEAILKHHERWDGTGYMMGLKGEQIPLECRVMSILDAFDAMTNDRPYRKALDIDYALKEIAQNAGSQFDPSLAYLFIEMVTKDRDLFEK